MADGASDTTASPEPSNNQNAECNGSVNPAFEDTEGLRNTDANDGRTQENRKNEENGHSTNGELKSPTKDGLPPAEAVNLELVTMSPYTNSIPVKKESTELDMTDPYDEYFVPVNQHKKYIRGEKLYVTQDKRENLSGSKKKCCCGVFLALVLGAAIAILVAVILTQDSGGLNQTEARNYDKASFGGNLIPTPPPRSSPSHAPPTTDMSQIYLKNVLEGELTIDNMEFTPGLSNSTSPEFSSVATSLEEEIKMALFDHQKLHYGASDISVKVIEFRPGSVIVTYRVGWKFKDGIHGASDPIDIEMLRAKLQKHLKDNDGFLYNYRVPVHSIKSNRVIDGCQIDNDGCSNGCMYNTTTLRILCTCPFGYKLGENGKSCDEIDNMNNMHPDSDVMPSSAPPMEHEDHEFPMDHVHPAVHEHPMDYDQEHSVEQDHPTAHAHPTNHEHPTDIYYEHHDHMENEHPTSHARPVDVDRDQHTYTDNDHEQHTPVEVDRDRHTPMDGDHDHRGHEHTPEHDIYDKYPEYEYNSHHSFHPEVVTSKENEKPVEAEHSEQDHHMGHDPTTYHEHSAGHDSTMDHEPSTGHDPTMDHEQSMGRNPSMDHVHSIDHDPSVDHEHSMGNEHSFVEPSSPAESSSEKTSEEHEMDHMHSMEKLPVYPVESSEQITEHDHEKEHDHSLHEHPSEMSSEHPMNSSQKDHEHTDEISETTSEGPKETALEKSHDQENHLAYLPLPNMPSMESEDKNSSMKAILDDSVTSTGVHNSTEDVPLPSDSLKELLPPLSNENVTSKMPVSVDMKEMQLPEYLPEYSTYADVTPDSQTEGAVSTSSEVPSMKQPEPIMENSEKMNEKPEMEGDQIKGMSTESSKSEVPAENISKDEIIITPLTEKNESLSENNSETSKTNQPLTELSQEAIMEAHENKTNDENVPMPHTTIEGESKKNDKSSTYPEVINDLHTIEGNPFETERLNELPLSHEVPAKTDNLYTDGSLTEKPIEHNVIETFREAKATDFNNSTDESSIAAIENKNETNSETGTTSDSAVVLNNDEKIDAATHETDEKMNKESVLTDETSAVAHDMSEAEMPVSVTNSPSVEETDRSKDKTEESMMHSTTENQVGLIKSTDNEETSKLHHVEEHLLDVTKEVDHAEVEQEKTMMKNEEQPILYVSTQKPLSTDDVKPVNDDQVSLSMATPHPEVSTTEASEKSDDSKPVIYVTQPPDSADQKSEDRSDDGKHDMPMIAVTMMPDVMTSSTTEMNDSENPSTREQNEAINKERAHVDKLLDDETNNLNSLEDDYDNDHLKSKYQKQGKSKLLKNFNIKEIYPHQNSSDKNPYQSLNPERTSESVKSPETASNSNSLNHLLSDEGYTTITPLFTSKTESSAIPVSSEKSEVNNTSEPLDQGLSSSEAYTTLSPIFGTSSQPPAVMTVDEVTTTSPLIFDLIEGKKVDPNVNEFNKPDVIAVPMNSSESSDSQMATDNPIVDLMNEMTTLPPGFESLPNESDSPMHDKNMNVENEETTVLPSAEVTTITNSDNDSVQTVTDSHITAETTLPPPSNENSSDSHNETMKLSNEEDSSATLKSDSTESPMMNNDRISTSNATQDDIVDPVVKLVMNSTYQNSSLYSKCASGQWACLDGSECIAPSSRCNSRQDCLDGSDEADCQEHGCLGNFQCASGECLARHLVCDSVPHCKDGSDENNCEEWKCNFDEMQCIPSSRKCIPSLWKCDSIPHCPKNEDEIGCKDACSNDEFLCPEGWCIALGKKCDGKSDCAKGEDELNCP